MKTTLYAKFFIVLVTLSLVYAIYRLTSELV